ncbi:MAG: tyrosine-type recombinase/integrase [Verrucomicrobiota bacterium]
MAGAAEEALATVKFKEKRSITWKEHQAIVARELNPERKTFFQLAWHLGASQSDIAFLEAENVDWETNVISFSRKKTRSIAIMRFDKEVAEILRDLPGTGPLFPYMRRSRASDRATEFKQRCAGLGIKGVTLHSYRYAWAGRAKTAGYPERFAQEVLGQPRMRDWTGHPALPAEAGAGDQKSAGQDLNGLVLGIKFGTRVTSATAMPRHRYGGQAPHQIGLRRRNGSLRSPPRSHPTKVSRIR